MMDRSRRVLSVMVMMAAGGGACAEVPNEDELAREIVLEERFDEIPNDLPIPNARGFAASFGNSGSVDLDNAFFTPQGTNGRHCGTCHAPENGWSINGSTVTELFNLTGGTHPIFVDHLDTDTPAADLSTVEARWSATTMLRQGKFTRRMSPPVVRDYDVVAASDPFGVGTTTSLFWFRRSMPTANLRSHTVNWDAANNAGAILREGLLKQARGNVVGAQGGGAPSEAVVGEIADYELQLSHAQLILWDAGRLDADGARGGPAHAAAQPLVAGRFDLYDAWENSTNAKRRQVWRGQELFNDGDGDGRRCGGCHNAANNGQSVDGKLFDIGASRPELARPDMAVYTFQSRLTGALVMTTDPGQGIRDGQFANLGKFKVPNLRGLVSRGAYFHNGIAVDLPAAVRHYEAALGFDFTPEQEADLVAFLEAL
jgi:cytochrome c peroxidase